ncbi:MAG: ROK family protein, partial [Candidatus Bipolaricaulia bacterium]
MAKTYLAGFDIGGTKLALVLADRAGEIIMRLREEVDVEAERFADYRGGVAYLGLGEQLVRLLRRALKEAGIAGVAAIGIGAAGPLEEGAIKDSTHIKPRKVPPEKAGLPLYIPLIEPLNEKFPVPIQVENDCTAAVLGEVYYGVGKEIEDKSRLHLVYVTISTGIGAGVWDGGRLLRGKDGNAAEVGHFFVKKDGLKCGCGSYGCAEAYCSGTGIAKNARMRLINEDLRPEGDYGSIILQLARERALGS